MSSPAPPKKRKRVVRPPTAGGALEASSSLSMPEGVVHLPKIPGVPMRNIPVFLEALRASAKFFQKQSHDESFGVVEWEQMESNKPKNHPSVQEPTTNNDELHDAIMNRMQQASAAVAAAYQSENDKEHQEPFVRAVKQWIQDLQYLARQQKRKQQQQQNSPTDNAGTTTTTTTEMNNNNNHNNPPAAAPVPYSMFLYLWELQQEHKKVSARRAALFLSGLLLLRSKDCRFHLDQETNLADWVEAMTNHDNTNIPRTNHARRLLQQEATAWISHLLHRGYGSIYAKLRVASKSLNHRCGSTVDPTTANESRGMAHQRRLRDLALRHGRTELQKVEQLLDRIEALFLVLVPRLSDSSSTRVDDTGSSAVTTAMEDDSDDDNSDIDWEDGDNEDGNGLVDNNHILASKDYDSHLSAVERTMVAIEQTSGTTLFNGGQLEIDFQRNDDDKEEYDNNINVTKARAKLERLIRKLSQRHLVRLSAWLEGLRNADGLVRLHESASLVSLTSKDAALRLELIGELSQRKEAISKVLSSASRINLPIRSTDTEEGRSKNRNQPLSLQGVGPASSQRTTNRTHNDRVRKIEIHLRRPANRQNHAI